MSNLSLFFAPSLFIGLIYLVLLISKVVADLLNVSLSLPAPEIKNDGDHLKVPNPAQVPKPILPHPKDHAAAEAAHHRQSELFFFFTHSLCVCPVDF